MTTDGKMTVCPVVIAVITLHCAAPWISGGRIINLLPGPAAAAATIVDCGDYIPSGCEHLSCEIEVHSVLTDGAAMDE